MPVVLAARRTTWPAAQPVHLSGNNDRFVLTRGVPRHVALTEAHCRRCEFTMYVRADDQNVRGEDRSAGYYADEYLCMYGTGRRDFVFGFFSLSPSLL